MLLAIIFVALLPIAYFLIRACLNLNNVVSIKEQFADTDYVKLLSSSISYLLFMIIWLLFDFYFLSIFLKKGEIRKNIVTLYKYWIQIIILPILIVANFVVKFVLSYNLQCVIYISTVIIVLIIIMISINLISLIKEKINCKK